MSITSPHFILFVLAVLGFYYQFPKFQRLTLSLSGIIFISLIDFLLLVQVLGLITLVYLLSILLVKQNSRVEKSITLAIGLIVVLSFIWATKYFSFTLDFLQSLFPLTDFISSPSLIITSTVGLSFVTFKLISVLVDAYSRKVRGVSFSTLITHITFFPEFLAGPIQRYADFSPQLSKSHTIDVANIVSGFERILLGFFKKLVIANGFAQYVDMVYADPTSFSSWNVLIAIYIYAFQLFFDFSGYTDIAIGVGKLFGLKIPENFNSPYLSLSVREFWRRWHITLSSWFKDYVYIPLGGNRKGQLRTILNILIVFLLTGLWHGSNWHFVLWGLLHGLCVAGEWFISKTKLHLPQILGGLRTIIRWAITFNLIVFMWIMFRASSVTNALEILESGLSFTGTLNRLPMLPIGIAILYGVVPLISGYMVVSANPSLTKSIRRVGLIIILISLIFFSVTDQSDFIYFKF